MKTILTWPSPSRVTDLQSLHKPVKMKNTISPLLPARSRNSSRNSPASFSIASIAIIRGPQQKKENIVESKATAPMFLNLLHADHMIPSEAESIFYKEYLTVEYFREEEQDHWWTSRYVKVLEHISAICSLVSLCDVYAHISIRYMACSSSEAEDWKEYRRCAILGKRISSFIAYSRREKVVTNWQPARDGKRLSELGCRYQTANCAYETRIGNKFLVRYNGDNSSEHDDSLCIQGPLKVLRWTDFRYSS
jgi:hypothetical protein